MQLKSHPEGVGDQKASCMNDYKLNNSGFQIVGTCGEFAVIKFVENDVLEPKRSYVLNGEYHIDEINRSLRYKKLDIHYPAHEPEFFQGYFFDTKYNQVISLHYSEEPAVKAKNNDRALILKQTVPELGIVPLERVERREFRRPPS